MNIQEVNKTESTVILQSMSNFLAGGSTILEAVEFTRDMFDGDHVGKTLNSYFMSRDAKLYRILQRVIIETREASVPIEEALATYKILSEDEKFVIQNPTEKPVVLIKKIIKERKAEGRFEKIMKKSFRTTFYFAYIVCIAMIWWRDVMVEKIKETQDSFSIKADLETPINIVPYYLDNQWFFIVLLLFLLILYYGSAYTFRYFYNNDRKVIYKYLPIKSWDDIPVMLQLMHSIRKANSTTTIKIFEILENNKSYNGLKVMFQRLQEHEAIREPKFVLFEEYKFPKEVSLLIRARENTSSGKSTDFWYEFENFIEFAKSTAEDKFDELESKIQIVPIALPYLFPMWLMTDLGLVFTSMMNMAGLDM